MAILDGFTTIYTNVLRRASGSLYLISDTSDTYVRASDDIFLQPAGGNVVYQWVLNSLGNLYPQGPDCDFGASGDRIRTVYSAALNNSGTITTVGLNVSGNAQIDGTLSSVGNPVNSGYINTLYSSIILHDTASVRLQSTDSDVVLRASDDIYIQPGSTSGVASTKWRFHNGGQFLKETGRAQIGTLANEYLDFYVYNSQQWGISTNGHFFPYGTTGTKNVGGTSNKVATVYTYAVDVHSGPLMNGSGLDMKTHNITNALSITATNLTAGGISVNTAGISMSSKPITSCTSLSINSGPTLNGSGLDMNFHDITDLQTIKATATTSYRVNDASDSMYFGVGSSSHYGSGAYLELHGNNNTGDCRLGAGGGRLLFYAGSINSNNAIRWGITNTGTLQAYNTAAGQTYLAIGVTDSDYQSRIQTLYVNRDPAGTNWYYLATGTNGGTNLQHILAGDGNVYIDGSFYDTGADYAEYFEFVSGESASIGETVVLVDDKIRSFNLDTDDLSDIIGVVRPDGRVASTNHPINWPNKYVKDVFGDFVLNEAGDRVINPEYDPEQEYIWRSARDEWVPIGLVGRVPVLKSASKNPSWIKMKDLSDIVELWFIK